MSPKTAKLLEHCREISSLCGSINRRAREAVEHSRLLREELAKAQAKSRELSSWPEAVHGVTGPPVAQ